jgi:DNA-binding transcriptional regulator YbjK
MITVKRSFTPLTIYINEERDAKLLEDALATFIDISSKQHSKWFGLVRRDSQPTDDQKYNAICVRKMLEALNPSWVQRPLWRSDYQ